ncbi:hypothetical protein TH53_24630 [Pedobacter lusitanus]|uniref:Uncharacterized protein n=1 Tax=Pedobacter lusitanus TaxID=1503925 RepID=A0A0D0EZG5_9SPHI|nr:hypothetical protein TH53_24630 [Pedobacter lusitanus]
MDIKRLITKSLLIILFTLLSVKTEAQHFKFRNVSGPTELSGELDFPVLTDKTTAANQINTFLQADRLDLLPGKQKKKPV